MKIVISFGIKKKQNKRCGSGSWTRTDATGAQPPTGINCPAAAGRHRRPNARNAGTVSSVLYFTLKFEVWHSFFFFFFFGSDLTWTMKTRFFALLILADFNLSLSRSRELASVPFVWAVAILHAPLVNEISFYFFFYSFHLFLHLTMAPKCFFVFLIVPYSKETNV